MSQMNDLEILKAARALLSDPAKHTIRTFARTATGEPVWSDSPNAVCWCAIGAVNKHIPPGEYGQNIRLESILNDAAFDLFGKDEVIDVNDNLGHESVLKVFDYAIDHYSG